VKVCMFTNTYLPHVGGVARSVNTFAAELRALGHEVLVVAPTYPEPPGGSPEDGGVLRVPAIQNFNGSDFSLRIPLPGVIGEALSRFGPDIVHSHHPYLLGDAALRSARLWGLPLVFTHHTFYERYTHYVPLDSAPMRAFVVRLGTEYANLCTGVVAPSASVERILRGRGVRVPLAVVPTGVDAALFAGGSRERGRRDAAIDPAALVIGHVGRLAPEKNLAFLARAAAMALRRLPGARFLVVGSGPEEEGIRETFRRAGLAGRLHVLGVLEGPALADAYAAMDLFAFASTSETQGMVLVEAMAAGVPVVALDAPGARDVVVDGGNGRLVDEDADAAAFAAALEAATAAGRRRAWHEGALRTARELSRRRCAERLLAFYRECTARGPVHGEGPGAVESLVRAIRAEWELVQEKVAAATGALGSRRGREARADGEGRTG